MAQGKRNASDKKTSTQGAGLSKTWTWALLAAVVVGFGLFVTEPLWSPLLVDADPPPEEQVAQGAALYQRNCMVCHGPEATGQDPARPNGGNRTDGSFIAPALNGTAHTWHHAPALLFDLVKNGSPAPESPMRGWSDRMTDAEIRAVLAYVQSLWPPELLARYRRTHGGA